MSCSDGSPRIRSNSRCEKWILPMPRYRCDSSRSSPSPRRDPCGPAPSRASDGIDRTHSKCGYDPVTCRRWIGFPTRYDKCCSAWVCLRRGLPCDTSRREPFRALRLGGSACGSGQWKRGPGPGRRVRARRALRRQVRRGRTEGRS
jgi:hypothetical protein